MSANASAEGPALHAGPLWRRWPRAGVRWPRARMPSPDETYASLSALRDAVREGGWGADAHWRVVRAKLDR